jgi:DNA-binding transcriptional LysR family regulator
MRFTLRQLDYFIAAGETGSITLASARLNISPPAISGAIAHLERELGVQLFLRHHAQGLSLTPAGQRMLVQAKLVLHEATFLYDLASEITGTIGGVLTIGCMVTVAPMILPELCHHFTARYPAAEIRPEEGDQKTLIEGLRSGRIELAVTYDLDLASDIRFEGLAELPPYALLAEDHPLAAEPILTLEALAQHPMILLDLPQSRDYFLALFRDRGLTPLIGGSSTHQEVLRTMVANNYGYALANARPRSDVALDGRKLVTRKLAGRHRALKIGLARAAQMKPTKLIEAFSLHCRAEISDQAIPGMAPPL